MCQQSHRGLEVTPENMCQDHFIERIMSCWSFPTIFTIFIVPTLLALFSPKEILLRHTKSRPCATPPICPGLGHHIWWPHQGRPDPPCTSLPRRLVWSYDAKLYAGESRVSHLRIHPPRPREEEQDVKAPRAVIREFRVYRTSRSTGLKSIRVEISSVETLGPS